MAKRRMFSIELMESDNFYELSALSQALYFHLNLNADDDGLVTNARSIMRHLKASVKNYDKLIEEGFIIELPSKVVAITHWHWSNRIKSDRYTPSMQVDVKKLLGKDENDRYFKLSEPFCGDNCAPQYSIDKESKDKQSKDKQRKDETNTVQDSVGEDSVEIFPTTHSSIQTDVQSTLSSQNGAIDENDDLPLNTVKQTGNNEIVGMSFKNKISLYFMKQYKTINVKDFMDYYEKRDWMDDDGESIVANYQLYIDRWMQDREK